ncbi:MAG: UDP-N-acetylmuramoyl-L-alanyl-D-glutamate--2,6-diaminopimelate ligase [Rhodoferax sp.]|nr:UDP-N-acetylmuramoyl-L-alanyl-D-glutamate--2,6-diaminopimelate ligase [Rhodoferax sp.]
MLQHLSNPTQAAQWLRERVTGTLRTDSRSLRPGDGFVATPGAVVDGRKFVAQALQQDVAACLVEADGVRSFGLNDSRVAAYAGLKADAGTIADAFFGHPSQQLALIAITGTNGKTSTAWWLAQALGALPGALAQPCALVGTLGMGKPPQARMAAPDAHPLSTLQSTGMTTPDAVALHSALQQFALDGVTACALEASSIGIEEGRMNGLKIRVAVFTNFTQDHLDYHGSMQAYWDAKRRLFDWPGLQSAVVNVDDPKGAALAEALRLRAPALDLWTTSCDSNPPTAARLHAQHISLTDIGLRFDVVEGEQRIALQSQVIGAYNVANLLGVIGSLRALGVDLTAAVQACAQLHAVPGRLDCVGGQDAPLVVVDYAHTPDALSQTLDALRPLAAQRTGQLWCIFGCGGDRDAAKRPLMGAIAAAKADQIVITSDNPRSEKPAAIVSQILTGVTGQSRPEVQVDRGAAIANAIARAARSDVILVAGKGHEETQDIGGVKTPFSDRAHALQALAARTHLAVRA